MVGTKHLCKPDLISHYYYGCFVQLLILGVKFKVAIGQMLQDTCGMAVYLTSLHSAL